jgi:ubiquitin C-terminal hydrolase
MIQGDDNINNLRGLRNIGNSCYFNSALQLIMRIPVFNTEQEITNPILCEMKKLHDNYKSNNNIDTNLKNLYLLCCAEQKYQLGSQQDSCEIVQLILDKVVDYIPTKKSNVRVLINQLVRCEGDNCNNKYKVCADQEESILISQALINSENAIVDFKPFLQSALEISECPNYNHVCNCLEPKRSVQTVLSDLPDYLVIKVGRCDNFLRKINKQLVIAKNFTLTTPTNLNQLCETGYSDQISHKYDISGLIVHYGHSLNSGHYVSFIKQNDKWTLCNDSDVREIPNFSLNMPEIRSNSCVLLYTRC